MSHPHTTPCPVCHGAGTVPHQKRRMQNGEPDPADFRTHELCEKCGGGGAVPLNPATIVERKPGYIADQTS